MAANDQEPTLVCLSNAKTGTVARFVGKWENSALSWFLTKSGSQVPVDFAKEHETVWTNERSRLRERNQLVEF